MNAHELFTSVVLAYGFPPTGWDSEISDEMTAYQLQVIWFLRDAGVKNLDDREVRRQILLMFFAWEAAQGG